MLDGFRIWSGRAWRRANRAISRAWIARRIVDTDVAIETYGDAGEAWWVPADIAPGAIAYCGGVGLDASYDFALVERKRLEVHSFDPAPSSIAYMERENRGRVHYHQWGVLGEDRLVRFHAPFDVSHGNWFVDNLHGTQASFAAECLTLRTIMDRLGHDRIDLLKIDIEGSWYGVLLTMIEDGIVPPTICVEFDSPAPLHRVRRVTLALEKAGYRAVRRAADNVLFLQQAMRAHG